MSVPPDAIIRTYEGQLPFEVAPAEGGGSQPVLHVAFPFAFNTPGLAAGIAVTGWTPAVGDVLHSAWLNRPTAWDGTTPLGNLFLGDDTVGVSNVLGSGGGLYDMTSADFHTFPSTNNWDTIVDYNSFIPYAGEPGYTLSVRVANGPLHVAVSQDGSRGGADPGATQGAAILHLLIALASGVVA